MNCYHTAKRKPNSFLVLVNWFDDIPLLIFQSFFCRDSPLISIIIIITPQKLRPNFVIHFFNSPETDRPRQRGYHRAPSPPGQMMLSQLTRQTPQDLQTPTRPRMACTTTPRKPAACTVSQFTCVAINII